MCWCAQEEGPFAGARRAEAASSASNPSHRLDGFIAYYGRHYFAYWRRAAVAGPGGTADGGDRWDGFDDASVRDAGSWADVVEKVSDGRLMPLLLFFSTLDAAPAPQFVSAEIVAAVVPPPPGNSS